MNLRLSIQCRQHLIDQHIERRQVGKRLIGEHEVIDAEIDKWAHLLQDLRRGANEIRAEVDMLNIERIHFGLGGSTNAATVPGTPQS